MDGDQDVFECLGLLTRSKKLKGKPLEKLPFGATRDESEDVDAFAALGLGAPEETVPPLKKKKIPGKLLQRMVWFEAKWKPVDELAAYLAALLQHGPQTRKQLTEKVLEYSPGTITQDITAAIKYLEEYLEQQGGSLLRDRALFPDDPYESDLHGTPHR